uniref:Centriolar and ciliogenesis-associated protein HYLS1 C-terminal domain-containing protein n=1 Tax=Panstrongylus lignarius TaxID=156445 RepID=A0A224XHS2_9HEMI
MSIELDPQEVLEHLYSLGYYNITKEQLKEFIKDLKKLIKYDLRKEERKNRLQNSNKENVCTCSVSLPTKDKSSFDKETASHLVDSNLKKDSPCRSCHAPPHSNLYSSKYDSSAEIQNKPRLPRACASVTEPSCTCNCFHERGSGFSKKLCPHVGEGETDGASSAEEYSRPCSEHIQRKKKESCTSIKKTAHSMKPCPSFIRPGSIKAKPPKADPVALYHYYKSLWSQHNLPGENSHENLRWRIRHRMMTTPVLAKGQNDEKVTKKPDWVIS